MNRWDVKATSALQAQVYKLQGKINRGEFFHEEESCSDLL